MLCACGFKYTPLCIQGLKRLVLWIQTLTLLEDRGLLIQALVLQCSCAKAASQAQDLRVLQMRKYFIYTLQAHEHSQNRRTLKREKAKLSKGNNFKLCPYGLQWGPYIGRKK